MKMHTIVSTLKRHAVTLLVLIGLTMTATAGHAGTLSCTFDGYAAMGGMVTNSTNAYVLGGDPDSEPTGEMETWGYGWLKFDASQLPSESVTSAILQLQSIAQEPGSMYTVPEGITGGIDVNVHAVTADVATITSGAVADSFRSSISTPADTITVTGGDGFYEWDVTDLVNSWIANPTDAGSLGLALTSSDAIPKFHASETAIGTAPVIQLTTVPEPGTIALALTLFGMLAGGSLLRRKFRRRVLAS